MITLKQITLVLILSGAVSLGACAKTDPSVKTDPDFSDADEIPRGPGLYSEEDGEITIFER